MTDRIEIKPTEHGVVRVFRVDLPEDEIAAFNRHNGSWPLQRALGAETLDSAHVDLFAVSDLEELGLVHYLKEGHGVAEDTLSDMRGRLDALTGHVLVIPSRAFCGQGQTLTPRHPLRLVATLDERAEPVSFAPLPSEGAKGTTGGKSAPSNAAMSGRIASIALLVLFLLVAIMIWIAA